MTDRKALALALNEAQSVLAARRTAFIAQAGLDEKRPQAWREYGYPAQLTFRDFYRAYDRQGLAHGVVHLLADKCMETPPRIVQDGEDESAEAETPWEKEFAAFAKRVKLWRAIHRADVRRLVGHFSAILLHIADSKQWDAEATPNKKVVKLTPVWEGQLTASSFDEDETSETYGDVLEWIYDESAVLDEDTDLRRARKLTVHHSRIVLVGDYYGGRSFLKAGYNSLINMEKILGGSGESFLKNASRQLHLGFDKDVDLAKIAKTYGVPVDELQTVFDQAARDVNQGIDSILVTQGGTASPLTSSVPQPQEHYNVNLQDAAAAFQIPAKIISGMQTGERASTEDARQFNQRCNGRRAGDLTDDTARIIEHLIKWGLITPPPNSEFTVVWDDLTAPTAGEKLDLVGKMADVNQKMIATGSLVFETEEMREAAGFENNEAVVPLPESDEEDDE